MAVRGPSHVGPLYGRAFLGCIVFITLLFASSTTAVTRTARFVDGYGSIDSSMTIEDNGLTRVVYRQLNGVAVRIHLYDNNKMSFYVDTTKRQSLTQTLALDGAVLSQPCDSTGPCVLWYNGNLYDLASMDPSRLDSSLMGDWEDYLLSTSFSNMPRKIVTGGSNAQVMLLVGNNVYSLDTYNVPLPDSEEFTSDFQGKIADVGISSHHSRVCVLSSEGLMGCWGFFEAYGNPPTMWQPHTLNGGEYFAAAYPPPYIAMSLVDIYMCMASQQLNAVRCFGASDEFALGIYDYNAVKLVGGPGVVCFVRADKHFHCESGLLDLTNVNGVGNTYEVRDIFVTSDKLQFVTPPDPEERCKYYISLPNGNHYCTMVGGDTPRRSLRWTTDPDYTPPKEVYADFKSVHEVTVGGTNYHVVAYSNGFVGILTADQENTLVAELSDAIVSEPCDEWMCAVYSRNSGGVLNAFHPPDENTAAALSPWTGEGGEGEGEDGGGTGGEGGGGGTGGEGERWSKKQVDYSLLTNDVTYLATSRGIVCAINGGPIACRGLGEEGEINVVYSPPTGRTFVKAIIRRSISQVIALLDSGDLYVMSLYESFTPYTSALSGMLGLSETVVDIAGHVDASGTGSRWCLVTSGGSIWCEPVNAYLEGSPETDDRWEQLTMSNNYVCARGNRGEWRCWGEFSTDYSTEPEYVPSELKSTVVQRVIAMPRYITLIACDQTGNSVDQFICGVPEPVCTFPTIPESSANKALVDTASCSLQCSGHWTRPDLACSVCGLAPSPGKVDTVKCECLAGWTGANCQTPCTLVPELGRYDVNYQTCSKVCIPPYHGAECDSTANTQIRHSTFWMPLPSDGLSNPAAMTGVTYKPAHKAFARGLQRTAFFNWPDGTKARAELYDNGVLQVVSRTSGTVLLRASDAVMADTCSYSTTWSNNNWVCMIYYNGILHDLSSGRNIRYALDYVPDQIAVSTVNNNFLTLDQGRVLMNGRAITATNLPTTNIAQIAVFGDYGAVLTSSGSVWVWNMTASSSRAQVLDYVFSSAIEGLSLPFVAMSARSGVCVVSDSGKAGCIDPSGESWLEFSGSTYTNIVSGWTFACATGTSTVNCQGSITLKTSSGTQTYSYANLPTALTSSVAVHADLYWAQFNRLPQPLSTS